MKNIIISIICIFLLSGTFAQDIYTQSQQNKAKKITEKLEQSLSLSESQTSEVEALYLDVMKRLDNAKKYSKTNEELILVVKQINVDRDNELRRILSVKQYELFSSDEGARNCEK